jgi:hypothetical protein
MRRDIRVHNCWSLVEVMGLGCVMEYMLCRSSYEYLTWKFLGVAEYYVVEFSVIFRNMRLVIFYCNMSWRKLVGMLCYV